MNYYEQDGRVILTDFDDFDIEQTLESGQCFRFKRLGEASYSVVAYGKVLYIEQSGGATYFWPCGLDEFERVWRGYFDLDRDYAAVKAALSANDPIMAEAVKFAPGIRLMNQDVWECLISFIISANNRIPMIMQVVRNISHKFGDEIGDERSFPTRTQLAAATLEDMTACRAGFRAKYILDAVRKVHGGQIDLDGFAALPTAEVKQALMSINGVGAKVADCVLLLSCRRREIFPIDVWIRRVVQELYFEGREIPLAKLQDFAREQWGENAGFANQYLFHYARLNKIGAKSGAAGQ
ncbi:MAG: hypothetical protein FWE20_11045 [Defluviitaleaceae bacterium]|nr:hypothetical protein [Defluviitaleaceae bacterium]